MKNDQILIGEVQEINLGRLRFDAKNVGIVNIKITNIAGLSATSNVYRIETTSRQRYIGTLELAEKSGDIYIQTPDFRLLMHLENINRLIFIRRKFLRRLAGNVNLGYNYTRSSNIGRFNFDGLVKYQGERADINLNGSTIITQQQDSLSRDRENLDLSAYLYSKSSWFALVLVSYQRNLQLGLLRRWQQGGGLGKRFLVRRHMQADLSSGLVVNQELGTNEQSTQVLVEAPVLFKFDFFNFANPDIQFTFQEVAYLSLSQQGRYRLDGDIRLAWEFIKDFALSLSFYTNYDSQPPSGEAQTFDFGIVTGLTIKFN
ncbi:MAG: DUF481 domain-containing protein [Cyclobacteriaceae bacterium]